MDDYTARLVSPVSERDHAQGLVDAPLTLVEYGDYQCPFCAAAYPVVKAVQGSLGEALRFVFRNFPLIESHPYALIAAEAAEAAAFQGRFWEMHDLLFERQPLLEPDVIPEWAQEAGLDLERFSADIRKKESAARIQEDRRGGIRSGVNGTPTFFINGRRHDGGPGYGALLAALEAEGAAPRGEAAMIKIGYDDRRRTLSIAFEGNVDGAQAEKCLGEIEKIVPKRGGFKLLADFSAAGTVEPEVQGEMAKAMDLVNARGVTEIFRVVPDPDLDIGFNVMSTSHYSRQVRIHTVRSGEEARALLESSLGRI